MLDPAASRGGSPSARDASARPGEEDGGPRQWRPLVFAACVSAAFLGIVQAAFLLVQNRVFLGFTMAARLTRLSMLLSVGTVLLVMPVAFLVRRLLPAWRKGDHLGASWAACFGLTAALVGWMIAALVTSSPAVSTRFAPWIDACAAIGAGLTASTLRPERRWVRAWAVVAPALVLLPFAVYPRARAKAEEVRPRPLAPGPARPDVVLVTVDTLRADHLGSYGRSPTITPEMDRIAREGVVFTRSVASGPWTVPSVASILTGLPTIRHGAGLPLGAGPTVRRSRLHSRFTTLAERFSAAGYRTRAVVANAWLHRGSGMDQGFDEYATPLDGAVMAASMRDLPLGRLIVALTPPEKWGDYRAQGLTDVALRWLDEPDPRPLFLWVHYVDPHSPSRADPGRLDPAALGAMVHGERTPPLREDGTVVGDVFAGTELVRSGLLWLGPRDRERLKQYYAGQVAYADKHVGRLFDALRARRAKRPVVASLTADHGEEFWDHGHFEHGHDYYREVTWVPLMFWGVGAAPAGRGVATVVGLVDVAPTLAELAGLPAMTPQSSDEGRSLAGLWGTDGAAEPSPPRFSGGNFYGLPAVLVEHGPWRFLLRANGVQELYDVTRDPQERHNVTSEHAALSEEWRQALEPQLAALMHTGEGSSSQTMSLEHLEALRALGYVR